MKTLKLTLQNIKCDGCIKSIKTAMEKHENIKEVTVVKKSSVVTIIGDDIVKSNIVAELTDLEYPEIKKGFFQKYFLEKLH